MNNIKTLGKVSADLISRLYDEDKTIFSISDAQGILKKKYNDTTDLLSRLVKRKVITRLKAGKFLIIPQSLGSINEYIGNWYITAKEIVNSDLYYIGFYSAMHYWGMLTQPLIKIFVVISRRQIVPLGMRDKLIFIFTRKELIWGIKEEWVTKSEKVKISDLERTIIDALAYPQHCGGITEIAKGIWLAKDRINYERLGHYVDKYGRNVVAKRLGYILEILSIQQTALLGQLRKYIRERYDFFDPTLPKEIINKNNWRLIDNIGKKQIIDLTRH